jgi:hypothetical protein
MIERFKERFHLVRPLLVPFILYIGLLTFSLSWVEHNPDSIWRYPIALAPMLPAVWIAMGVIRAFRQLDELSRMVLYEGLAIASLLTFLVCAGLGLLQMAGLPRLNSIYIALFMIIAWLIGKLLVTRRYQ